MGRPKLSLKSRLKQALLNLKDTNIIINGTSLYCQKCSETINYAEYTISSRLREHVKSEFHKKSIVKKTQPLIEHGLVKQQLKTNETNQFNRELIEAITAADIPITKLITLARVNYLR